MDRPRTLGEALDSLESRDPEVRAARERLDDALDSMSRSVSIQPEIDAAKREAVLGLLGEKYAAKDQDGLAATIQVLMLRGYALTRDDLRVQLLKQSAEVVAWWQEPCDCSAYSASAERP